MAKKSRAAKARAKAITRIQQQHPRAAGGPSTVTYEPQDDDTPFASEMLIGYTEAATFAHEQPEMTAVVRAWGDDDVVDIVLGIADHPGDPFTDELALTGAAMLRRWAIWHQIVWLYDWEIPIAALSDAEIVTAILSDKLRGNLPERPPEAP